MPGTLIVFWAFAGLAIGSALACITRRNPVASALWLVVTLFSLAALFVILDAQFIAVLQVLVYAGAIMVLFLFVIMLLNLGRPGPSDIKGSLGLAVGVVLAVVLFAQLGVLWAADLSASIQLPPETMARTAAERDHHLHVRRADAQRREPHVRGAGAAARRRRPGVRLLRDGGRGRRGGGRPRHHSRDLPSPPDGQSSEHQPAEGLMPGSLLPAAPPAPPLWLVPALPLLGFVLNGVLALARPAAKRVVSLIGVGVLVLACAAAVGAVVAFSRLPGAEPLVVRPWEWLPVGDLQVDFALQLDPLSAVMILVVTGVGALIHVFSVGYMHDDPGYARYFAYLNLFVFFMLILVLGASFPVMFVGWEGVGLCSYLLIGFWFNEQVNADAGKKAFIVNRI